MKSKSEKIRKASTKQNLLSKSSHKSLLKLLEENEKNDFEEEKTKDFRFYREKI